MGKQAKKINEKSVIKKYEQGKSIRQIAKDMSTYPNRIMGIIKKHGKLRNKSEAQKLALKEGRSKHPTEGKERDEETKLKISQGMGEHWDNLSDEEKEEIRKRCAENFSNRTEEELREMRERAVAGLNKARLEGSKMEHIVKDALLELGYKVEFHREQLVESEKLQMDLFLPDLATAIEIDGPFHSEKLWGDKRYKSSVKQDYKKDVLLTQNGFNLIRIKHLSKTISERYKRDFIKAVLENIKKVKGKKGQLIRVEL